MSKYTATVIKTGNSYALRVPKDYVTQSNIKLGQKVLIGSPLMTPKKHDPVAIKQAIKNLQKINAFGTIKDPISWQREIRTDRSLPGRD